MASTEPARGGALAPTLAPTQGPTLPPKLQLWTPPSLDASAWARVVDVVLGNSRSVGLVDRIPGGPTSPSKQPTATTRPPIGVLLRLPGARDEVLAGWWRELHLGVGRPGHGCVALGLRLEGAIDAARLERLGLARWPCDWLHLASNASSVADVRAAWSVVMEPGAGAVPADAARPLVVSRAAHDEASVRAALAEGVDAMTLSPVCATASKPDVPPLGWERFASLAALAPGRLWALGGLRPADLDRARRANGGGVALLGAAWSSGAGDWPNLAADAAASP